MAIRTRGDGPLPAHPLSPRAPRASTPRPPARHPTSPGRWVRYLQLDSAVSADGALDGRTKQLIGLAIAVSKQCDGCIADHAQRAARSGATDAEVAEALRVAMTRNGGPGTVHGPRAFAAYREFGAAEQGAHDAVPVPGSTSLI